MTSNFPFQIWAIADLHLSFGVPNKSMEVFGEQWKGWTEKLAHFWNESIRNEDLVLLPGDLSWGMRPEQALPDLEWIDRLPGTKVLIRGNHDYWWTSKSKVSQLLPPSLHLIQNDAFHFQGVAIAGARLWDTQEYHFLPYINVVEGTPSKVTVDTEEEGEQNEKVFQRELNRLELSLKKMDPNAPLKICMTHYPPIDAELNDSRASALMRLYGVEICVFGHLHSVKKGVSLFGEGEGIRYYLTSCDYLDFKPLRLIP